MKLMYLSVEHEIYTPHQVTLFGECQVRGEVFIYPDMPDPEIQSAVMAICKSMNNDQYRDILSLCHDISFKLRKHYSFKYGFSYEVNDDFLPRRIRDENPEIRKFLEFAIRIMTAHGWIADIDFNGGYVLKFVPMESLSPDEVTFEIQQKVYALAGKALAEINRGHVDRQTNFSTKQLGVDSLKKDVDLELFFTRLQVLLGPKWVIDHRYLAQGILITPATS